jgi:hypothetical protein
MQINYDVIFFEFHLVEDKQDKNKSFRNLVHEIYFLYCLCVIIFLCLVRTCPIRNVVNELF